MKKIPTPLRLILSGPGKSTCFLVKIVCKDGTVLGFTTLDTNLTFDDGLHVVTYDASQELRPQNLQQELDFSVDNTDLTGWFNSEVERLVLAGMLDLGEITVYRVSYLRLSAGAEVIAYGTVGQVDFAADKKSKRKVEFRSLTQQLQQNITQPYSLTCRASFGDERCTMPFVWQNGSVASVGDNPYTDFVISGVTAVDSFFDLGVVEFLTGNNAGADLEIETWLSDGTVHMSFLAPYPVNAGDTLRIRQDCDKTETACKSYGNLVNMRAEHLTPVQDQSVMVPGAYIKSQGAK